MLVTSYCPVAWLPRGRLFSEITKAIGTTVSWSTFAKATCTWNSLYHCARFDITNRNFPENPSLHPLLNNPTKSCRNRVWRLFTKVRHILLRCSCCNDRILGSPREYVRAYLYMITRLCSLKLLLSVSPSFSDVHLSLRVSRFLLSSFLRRIFLYTSCSHPKSFPFCLIP